MTKSELEAKFDTFLSDNNGKFIKSLPNSLNPQCFDLTVAWTNLLGIPHVAGNPSPFPYANAYQIYTDFGAFQSQYFDRIPNTPDYVPLKGDILSWDGKLNGGIGHTAVALGKGDTKTFQSFDENWSIGSPAKIITHDYNYLLGCLRLKVTQPSTQPQPPMATLPTELQHYSEKWKEIAINKGFDVNAAQFADYRATDALIASKVKPLEKENGDLSEQIDEWIKAITAEGLDPQNFQSSLHELLAQKDKECQEKIQSIKDIPPTVKEIVTEIPKQAKNQWLNGLIQFLYTLDR